MYDDSINDLIAKYKAKAKRQYQGRNRIVFVLGNIVVKIPKNIAGIGDNIHEASCGNTGRTRGKSLQYEQYPRTRLAYYHTVPVLFMEHVKHAFEEDIHKALGTIPRWVWETDCQQVGFTRHGNFVVYDFGTN